MEAGAVDVVDRASSPRSRSSPTAGAARRTATRLVQGIGGVNTQAQVTHPVPLGTFACGCLEGLGGSTLKILGISPFGVNFQQLMVDRDASRVDLQGFFQNLFGL